MHALHKDFVALILLHDKARDDDNRLYARAVNLFDEFGLFFQRPAEITRRHHGHPACDRFDDVARDGQPFFTTQFVHLAGKAVGE